MKYTLVISSAAQRDIANALADYVDINPELAERLLNAIDEAYEKMEGNPNYYSFYGESETLRRYLLKTFSYCFIYQIKADEIFVFGFHHTHTNPDTILKRT